MAISSITNFINGAAFSSTYTTIAEEFHKNSANGAYFIRSGARVPFTPEDRRLDYFWRDAAMTVVTAYFFELCFRTVDANYKSPLITKTLQLERLAELYKEQLKRQFPGMNDKDLVKINYNGLDHVLNHRLLKPQLKVDNFKLVPGLLEHDLEKLFSKDPATLTGDEQIKAIQARQVVSHLQRRLNYINYLKHEKKLSPQDATKIVEQVESCYKSVEAQLKKEAGFKEFKNPIVDFYKSTQYEKKLMELLENSALKNDRIDAALKNVQGVPEKIRVVINSKVHEFAVKDLIKDGIDSKFAQAALKRISSSGEWPKLVLSLVTNILYFGIAGNWVDFNIIQPWQKKISDERGGVKELISPAYAAIIPGALTTAALSYVPMISKLGPATRFLIAGTAGMAAYAASSYAFVMARLQNLRKDHPVQKPAAQTQPNKPASANPTSGGPFSAMPIASFQSNGGFTNFPPKTINNSFAASNAFMPMAHNMAQGFGTSRFSGDQANTLQKHRHQAYSE